MRLQSILRINKWLLQINLMFEIFRLKSEFYRFRYKLYK